MKIRIGNDIRLKILLATDVANNQPVANVLTARAFFVNTTLKEKLEKEYIKKNRFIGRFPIEPFVDEFEPCCRNINSVGYPNYRAYVHNTYNGFGVNPDWKKSMPIRDVDITKYQSEVERTVDPDTIIVTFPAEALLYEGTYELIVVSQIYDEGYKNNVRTITINHKNVFELVSDSEEAGVTSPVQIEITNESNITPRNDIYVVAGSYSDGNVVLNRNDHGSISIDISPINDWYEGD